MDTFLKIFIVMVLALAFVGWLADPRGCQQVLRHAWTFASARRYQIREPEWKCPRLFPYRDIDCPIGGVHSDPPLIQLSATVLLLRRGSVYALVHRRIRT